MIEGHFCSVEIVHVNFKPSMYPQSSENRVNMYASIVFSCRATVIAWENKRMENKKKNICLSLYGYFGMLQ